MKRSTLKFFSVTGRPDEPRLAERVGSGEDGAARTAAATGDPDATIVAYSDNSGRVGSRTCLRFPLSLENGQKALAGNLGTPRAGGLPKASAAVGSSGGLIAMLDRAVFRRSGERNTDDAAKPRFGAAGGELIRKNRALAIGLGAVILSSLVSWGAASRIRSPAEVAARTAPPKPSAITVPVEKRVLASDVVVRGTVRYGAPQSVLLPASSIRRGSPILTTAPVKGKDLTEGSVAFSISGRPALVLQGAVPAHRDITPGTVGDDVRQLQAALGRLGFNPGRTDGVYDHRTELAVAAWYLKGGWTPSGPSEEQLSTLRSAQADWFSAESDLLAAQEALTAAQNDYEIAKQRAAAASRGATPPPTAAHGGAPTSAPARSSADDQAASRAEQERVAAEVRVQEGPARPGQGRRRGEGGAGPDGRGPDPQAAAVQRGVRRPVQAVPGRVGQGRRRPGGAHRRRGGARRRQRAQRVVVEGVVVLLGFRGPRAPPHRTSRPSSTPPPPRPRPARRPTPSPSPRRRSAWPGSAPAAARPERGSASRSRPGRSCSSRPCRPGSTR